MRHEEVAFAIDSAAEEGWNPGLFDAECFFQADPNGFFIGQLDEEPVACISAVKYGGSFGFIGLYIVKPEYRGKGYGLQIWNAGLHYLRGRNIGLDGVVAQQANYKKSGFKLAYRNIRYEGFGRGRLPNVSDPEIVQLSTVPFEEISAYDKPFFPENRTQFLKCWINQPQSVALGTLQSGRLTGYGVLRACRSGYKVGPLFADSPDLADSLFQALTAHTEGAPIYLDVPEVNPAAVQLAERNGMHVVFETARMYTGDAPALPLMRLFGITTFELG
jgi:GNAT superfamily N-acetyltransferase